MIVTFPHLCRAGERAPPKSAPVSFLRVQVRTSRDATASRSMEFHRRILGRQFASCVRISGIPSPCIGTRALIAVADRRKKRPRRRADHPKRPSFIRILRTSLVLITLREIIIKVIKLLCATRMIRRKSMGFVR